MEKAFSDDEIRRYIPNILKYSELKGLNVNTLKLPVVILYLTSIDHGHWTLLHQVGNTLEFFDSYGIKPDHEFEHIGPEMQFPKYLAKLLAKISETREIHYNPYQFQAKRMGVNTCGRWVIVRHMYPRVDIDKFKHGIDMVCQETGLSKDELVIKLT